MKKEIALRCLAAFLVAIIIVFVIRVAGCVIKAERESLSITALRNKLTSEQGFQRLRLLPVTYERGESMASVPREHRSMMWSISGGVDSEKDVIELSQFLMKHELWQRVELNVGVGTNDISPPHTVDDVVRLLQPRKGTE